MSRRLREVQSFDFSYSGSSSSGSSTEISIDLRAYTPFKQTIVKSLIRGLSFSSCKKFSRHDVDDDFDQFVEPVAPLPALLDLEQLQIGPQFAAGASGNLYHGIYEGQAVAVKLFHESHERVQEEQNSCQFLQEIATMSVLEHPNILRFIGAFWEGRVKCLVTEFMAGGNLNRFLRRRQRRLPFGLILKLAHDIARGMEYLHKKGIIHRDLKSENILLDSNGTIKIMDFGISKFSRPGGDDVQMTAETGTYRWMAPEVIQGKPYSNAVDVYSFSIVCWELYTREQPFDGLTPMQAVFSVVHKGLRPNTPVDCPENYRNLIQQCWHSDPSQRPTFPQIVELLSDMRVKYENPSCE